MSQEYKDISDDDLFARSACPVIVMGIFFALSWIHTYQGAKTTASYHADIKNAEAFVYDEYGRKQTELAREEKKINEKVVTNSEEMEPPLNIVFLSPFDGGTHRVIKTFGKYYYQFKGDTCVSVGLAKN